MNNVYGYPAAVWVRFSAGTHAGRLQGAEVVSVQAGTVAGKSLLALDAQVEQGRIADARFLAYGCPVTVAVGDWVAEQLRGAEVAALHSPRYQAASIRAALEIPDDRAHCALMGEDLVRHLAEAVK